MFHPLEGITAQEAQAANVKQFAGDGTPYLKVPGLKSVKSVRIGTQVLPMEIKQRFPKDSTGKELIETTSPMVQVQNGPDGTPILLRSIQSNDGVWQAGAQIFIQGDWEDDAPAEEQMSSTPPANTPPAK